MSEERRLILDAQVAMATWFLQTHQGADTEAVVRDCMREAVKACLEVPAATVLTWLVPETTEAR